MTVSEQIIEVLNFLGQKFGIAIDWTSESVVPVIQNLMSKYIRWEIATSIGWLVFAVAIIGAYVGFVVLYHLKTTPQYRWDFAYEIAPWLVVIIGSFLFVPIITLLCVQVSDIIKCITFPEMQIAEYVASLMSKG